MGSVNMLNEFEKWFSENQPRFKRKQYNAVVSRPSALTNKSSIRADIDTPEHIARITLWESGECEREAIDIKTEQSKFGNYTIVHNPRELYQVLDSFLAELS